MTENLLARFPILKGLEIKPLPDNRDRIPEMIEVLKQQTSTATRQQSLMMYLLDTNPFQ